MCRINPNFSGPTFDVPHVSFTGNLANDNQSVALSDGKIKVKPTVTGRKLNKRRARRSGINWLVTFFLTESQRAQRRIVFDRIYRISDSFASARRNYWIENFYRNQPTPRLRRSGRTQRTQRKDSTEYEPNPQNPVHPVGKPIS